jgi:long-chain acyl-CoA synthetase
VKRRQPRNVAEALLGAEERDPTVTSQMFEADGGAWEGRTAGELRDLVLRGAAGLRSLGLRKGERVGLVADCGPWWIVGDLAVLAAGGVDVPRGSDSTSSELGLILSHSGAAGCLTVGEEATRRVLEAPGARGALRFVVRLDAAKGGTPEGVLSGEEFLGRAAADPRDLAAAAPSDPASIIYTSGTTGRAKGVTLLHGNFLHQLRALPKPFDFRHGDTFLLMLPPWHCFERIVEYVGLFVGGTLAYSEPRRLRDHLPAVKPSWMASVPRVWEMVLALSGFPRLARKDPERAAKGLRAALGGNLRCAVCGGGSIPDAVDRAYNGAGIRFLVGYGLTETSPVLTVRLPGANRLGTVGRPVAETQLRIVDRETRTPVGTGAQGVIQARGPQVMHGYWKDPDLTAGVLDGEGWFDTGDIGALTADGDLEFRGRAKDTIVLRGGEKVEPQPLEDRLLESPFLDQAVVVGSDRKVLGALLVPRKETVEGEVLRRKGGAAGTPVGEDEVEALLKEECARLLTEEAGFMAHERVARVLVVPEPFTVENGLLTGTLKVKRPAVLERYAAAIDRLMGD